jgi:hypothetical protein
MSSPDSFNLIFKPVNVFQHNRLVGSHPGVPGFVLVMLHSPPLPRSGRLCPAIPACCDSKQVFGTADRCCTGRVTSLADVVVLIKRNIVIL